MSKNKSNECMKVMKVMKICLGIPVNEEDFKDIEQFSYLNSIITNDSGIQKKRKLGWLCQKLI